DGQVWGIESEARDVSEALGRDRPAGTVRQTFTIGALTDRWLPAAYEPRATDLQGARVVPESGTLVGPSADISGLTYRVDSRAAPPPPPAAKSGAPDKPVPADVRSSLQLPADFPRNVVRQARDIVRDARTPYDQAKALERFFTSGRFTYSLDGPIDGSGNSA